MRVLRLSLITALMSLFAAFSVHAGGLTKADAQAMVEQAVDFGQKHGKDMLLKAVNDKTGQFNKGELYVFVYDMNGTLIADPNNPNLVGQNTTASPDIDGKLFRKEFVDVATKDGSGWVNYRWKNPVSGKVQPKSAYVKRAGDIIIISGIYL